MPAIALIGQRFMGRAHSNAWSQVQKFFELGDPVELKVLCGRERGELEQFAARWGWEEISTDWREVVKRDDVDIVDISVPQHLHAEIAIEAARHGKHLFCEKPLCVTVAEARAMLAAAREAGVVHYLNHNYRRCPAVALAKRIVDEGGVGEVYHWRGAYQQSWLVDPERPMDWRLRKEAAQAGPLIDLGTHNLDLARHLGGEIDVASLSCRARTFVRQRPEEGGGMGEVTVDDAALMGFDFVGGGMGSVEVTRFATGRRNRHSFELYGSEGAIAWDLEDMNRLRYYREADGVDVRGWRDILVTEPGHPYVGRWWPPGHIIGYEHSFVHAAADFLEAVAVGARIRPDFEDGLVLAELIERALG